MRCRSWRPKSSISSRRNEEIGSPTPMEMCETNSTNSPVRRSRRGTELARIPQAVSRGLHPSRRRTTSSSASVWKWRGRTRDTILLWRRGTICAEEQGVRRLESKGVQRLGRKKANAKRKPRSAARSFDVWTFYIFIIAEELLQLSFNIYVCVLSKL